MQEKQHIRKIGTAMSEGYGEPITFTCYRIEMEKEKEPEGEVHHFSVTMISPEGELTHQVFSAREPEDVGESLRVPPGTRVIMTEMANMMVWDSQAPESEPGGEAESYT